ncbi:unnamed protein product, partial [Phaeothamnion confervicola]
MEALKEAVAGALGALLSAVALYPLDIAKTHVQIDTPIVKKGRKSLTSEGTRAVEKAGPRNVLARLALLLREHGFRRLFHGLDFKMLQTLASSFIYFYAYAWLKVAARRRQPGGRLAPVVNLLAAALAGAFNIMLTLPLENIVTHMQTRHIHDNDRGGDHGGGCGGGHSARGDCGGVRGGVNVSGSVGGCSGHSRAAAATDSAGGKGSGESEAARAIVYAATASPVAQHQHQQQQQQRRMGSRLRVVRQLYAQRGSVARFWHGLAPSLALTSNPAINYTAFDYLKALYLRRLHRSGGGGGNGGGGGSGGTAGKDYLGPGSAFLVACVAKAVATVATYPLIRAKVVLMAHGHGGHDYGGHEAGDAPRTDTLPAVAVCTCGGGGGNNGDGRGKGGGNGNAGGGSSGGGSAGRITWRRPLHGEGSGNAEGVWAGVPLPDRRKVKGRAVAVPPQMEAVEPASRHDCSGGGGSAESDNSSSNSSSNSKISPCPVCCGSRIDAGFDSGNVGGGGGDSGGLALQQPRLGMLGALAAIVRDEGPGGLYAGCGGQLLHTILKSALLLVAKEELL